MADCVWCQNANINAKPPCEWVKENLNKNEIDFTSPFPCIGTKMMYQNGNWGNNNNEQSNPSNNEGGMDDIGTYDPSHNDDLAVIP